MSSKEDKKEVKKDYPIIEIGKASITLSKKIMGQIASSHAIVGKKEWSGLLFYKIKNGEITDPDNLEIFAEELVLFDIDSAAYTEYENFGVELLELYEETPRLEKPGMYFGHIHSHHDMSTFFSGTDMQELHDNVGNHTFYLSLIVNFSGEYSAKLVYLADVEKQNTFRIKDQTGEEKTAVSINKTEKAMVSIDFRFFIQNEKYSVDRISIIEKRKEEKKEKEKKERNTHQLSLMDNYGKTVVRGYTNNENKSQTEESKTRYSGLKEEAAIRSFISKLIFNSLNHEDTLANSMMKFEEEFIMRPGYTDIAIDTMIESFRPLATIYFKRDFDNISLSDLAKSCIDMIKKFSALVVSEKLIELFEIFLMDELNDEEDKMKEIEKELNNEISY